MCAVRRAECVVDEDLRIACQLLCKLGIVLGLFFVVAQVLQQDNFAVSDGGNRLIRALPNDIFREGYLGIQQHLQTLCHGSQRKFRLEFALGPAQMRAEDNLCLVIQKILDGGQRSLDAGFVGNLALVVQRHVKIYPNQYFFGFYRNVFNRLLFHDDSPFLAISTIKKQFPA